MALIRKIGFTRFSRWGDNLGRLTVLAAKHVDALDGTDELSITCADEVSKGDYIVWYDARGIAHEHIVDEVERRHGEDNTVETSFKAVNSIAELWDDWTDDIRPSGSVATALESALSGTRWNVGACDQPGSTTRGLYHQSVRESVAEIAAAWGGELETTIVTDGTAVTSRAVGVRRARGDQNSAKRFTWTKDILSISRNVASENPKTRVYGYGRGVETDSGGFGRRLTFADINGGLDYVEDTDATEVWGHPGADGTVLPACTSYVNEQCEDAEQLLAETRAYLAQVSEPKVSYTASVIDLQSFGRSWEGVGVGDKVAIIDKGFCADGIRLTGRVAQIERDLLSGDAVVTFGNLSDSMANMWQSVAQSLSDATERTAAYDAMADASPAWLETLQAALNQQFASAGTYKVETFDLGTIYSNVALDQQTGLPLRSTSGMWAVNLSGRGIRLASGLTSGGQWNWKTFITGASVTADAINAGTMTADRIRLGLLQDKNNQNRWNLDTGRLFTTYMEADQMNATNMTATGASIYGNLTCGEFERQIRILDGTMYGYKNGYVTGSVNYASQSRNAYGTITDGLQLYGSNHIRIVTPSLLVAESSSPSSTAYVTASGTYNQTVIYRIDNLGDGAIQWYWTTVYVTFRNGLCTNWTT